MATKKPKVAENETPEIVEETPEVVENETPEMSIEKIDVEHFKTVVYHGVQSNNDIRVEAAKVLQAIALQSKKVVSEATQAEYTTLVIGVCTNMYNTLKDTLNGGVGQQMVNLVYRFAEEANNEEVRSLLKFTKDENILSAEVKDFQRLLTNIGKLGSPINEVYDPEVVYESSMLSTKRIPKPRGSKQKVVNLWDWNRNEKPFTDIAAWETAQKEIAFEASSDLTKVARGAMGRLFKLDVAPQMTKGQTEEEFEELLAAAAAEWQQIMMEEFKKAKAK